MEDVKKMAGNAINHGRKIAGEAREKMQDFVDDAEDSFDGIRSPAEATSLLSPSIWIMLALGSMMISAVAEAKTKKKEPGNFFGLWAPCFLIMGIFSKMRSSRD